MYRKSGSEAYSSSAEHRFAYKSTPFRMTEKKAPEYSSEHVSHERDKDVFIRSRTFQNSNWRQPQAWDKPSSHSETSHLPVNNFMPHFLMKKESNYTPTLKAVDNLTPKFLNIDLHSDNDATPNTQPQQPGNGLGGTPRNNQNFSNNSWRKPNNTPNHTDPQTNIKRKLQSKLHAGTELTALDRKNLAQPESLTEMLGSKTGLFKTMNELDSKTLKVQVDDFRREEQACEHVKQEMLSLYPDCNVRPYGIRLLGMAHPQTAIYMFFDMGNMYFQASNENKELQTAVRKSVYEVMKNCGHCENIINWDVQELVTFKHMETQMNCIVSFANGFKDQNTLLLKSYLKTDKRLRLLMLLVTDMVYRYYDISKRFTSYVLNIMVIMFLQRIPDPILPSLQRLRESFPYDKVIIGGFDCGFPKDFSLPSTNHMSVETLLKQFCAFYKDFKYEEDLISILGPELKRSMFCPPYEVSVSVEPLHSYLKSLKDGKNDTPKMNCDLPVIVQDPFELSCNAAEKVNLTTLEVFKMMCQDAYDILSKWC